MSRPPGRAVVRGLLMVDGQGRLMLAAAPVWTVLPVLALLLLTVGVALARRWWGAAALASLPLGTALLVFATAPASFFMYYLPTLLTGWLVVVLVAARFAGPAPERVQAG